MGEIGNSVQADTPRVLQLIFEFILEEFCEVKAKALSLKLQQV